jgi:hypothetical protein
MCAINVKECILHGKSNNNLTFVAQKTAFETPLPAIVQFVKFAFYQQNVLSRVMSKEERHRTNYDANEPLNATIRSFNRFCNIYKFGVNRGGFGAEIRRYDERHLITPVLAANQYDLIVVVNEFHY